MTVAAAVTLLTDFGWTDPWLAEVKGTLLCQWRRYPHSPHPPLVDLAHDLPTGDIAAGAWFLERVHDSYPAGTVHLAVIDPGVGGDRPAVAVAARDQIFVGPGNGLFGWLREDDDLQVVRLDNPLHHRTDATNGHRPAEVSSTFHGRDIFAPATAHLAAGVPLWRLGNAATAADLGLAPAVASGTAADGIVGHVRWIDRFGNAVTDLARESVAGRRIVAAGAVSVVGRRICGPVTTYADATVGTPFWYWGSGRTLEIALRGDSAARQLGLKVGLALTVPGP